MRIPLVLRSLAFRRAGSSKVWLEGAVENRCPTASPPMTLRVSLSDGQARRVAEIHIALPEIDARRRFLHRREIGLEAADRLDRPAPHEVGRAVVVNKELLVDIFDDDFAERVMKRAFWLIRHGDAALATMKRVRQPIPIVPIHGHTRRPILLTGNFGETFPLETPVDEVL